MLVTKLHISPKLEQNYQFNTIYDCKLGIISYVTGYVIGIEYVQSSWKRLLFCSD